MQQRLQKCISEAGVASRRAAETMISTGRVTVNGLPAHIGDSADPKTDVILVDGKTLPSVARMLTIMLHKPRGVVTTLHDEKGRRDVSELISEIPERLVPVGRLDMDSEGLLLMTNDGALANRLMHPSHEVEKVYRTWVRGDVAAGIQRLRQPMELDGYRLHPAKVKLLEPTPEGAVLEITIHEGRNRQVRRMCEQAGLTVTRLCRVREGGLVLGDLRPGQWRELTEEELRKLGVET